MDNSLTNEKQEGISRKKARKQEANLINDKLKLKIKLALK